VINSRKRGRACSKYGGVRKIPTRILWGKLKGKKCLSE
jgi:hypothetical protein